jgi:hypothetical protein
VASWTSSELPTVWTRTGKAGLTLCYPPGVGKKDKKARAKATLTTRKLPKTECCVSKKRCERCPLRMLKEGTLPIGYTVHKRKLVRLDGKKVTKKKLAKAA